MTEQITALLSQALATALKEALVPIVREAVTEALKQVPQAEASDMTARLGTIEERLDTLESDMSDKVDTCDIDDKVSESVQDCIDNGSFSIEFRG